jgi:hypothetical protein
MASWSAALGEARPFSGDLKRCSNSGESRGAQNPRPIDKHYETIRTAMQGIFHQLGLAA